MTRPLPRSTDPAVQAVVAASIAEARHRLAALRAGRRPKPVKLKPGYRRRNGKPVQERAR